MFGYPGRVALVFLYSRTCAFFFWGGGQTLCSDRAEEGPELFALEECGHGQVLVQVAMLLPSLTAQAGTAYGCRFFPGGAEVRNDFPRWAFC